MWLDELMRIKKESGKTTGEIAEMSGISVGTLNKIFAGQTKNPQLETIKAVVYCMGHSLDDLFGGIERKALSGEAATIAAAYDRADDKSRKMARLALEDFVRAVPEAEPLQPAMPETKNVHDWTGAEMHAELQRQLDAEKRETDESAPSFSGSSGVATS